MAEREIEQAFRAWQAFFPPTEGEKPVRGGFRPRFVKSGQAQIFAPQNHGILPVTASK